MAKKPAFWINLGAWWDWALARNGIYFISYSKKTPPNATLEFFEFATHRIIPISTLDKRVQGIGRISRRQIHSLCSKSSPPVQHHVGEKLSLSTSKFIDRYRYKARNRS